MSDPLARAFDARIRRRYREFRDVAEERAYLEDAWTTFGTRMRTAVGFAGGIALLGVGATVSDISGSGDLTTYIATRIVFLLSLAGLIIVSFRPRLPVFVAHGVCFSIMAGATAWVLPRVVDTSVAGPGAALLFAAMTLLVLLPMRFWFTIVAATTVNSAIAVDFALAEKSGAEIEFSAIMLALTLIGTRTVLQTKRFSRYRYFTRQQLTTALDELRQQQEQVQRAARQLQMLLEAMDLAVAMIDKEQRFIAWNSNFERMFEMPPGFMYPGRPFSEVAQRLIDAGYFGQREVDDRLRESVRAPVSGDRFELPLPGGRYIDIHRSGLADGGMVTTYTDITERKKAENLARLVSMQDPLTRLANRALFLENLNKAIAESARFNLKVALLMVDLDHFKPVNDSFGHPVGDAVLQRVAAILNTAVRDLDTVARLGGDEFAIVLTNLSWADQAALPARRILAALQAPMEIDGRRIQIGGSIGIAFFPDHGTAPDTLIAQADAALYAAKAAGRNRIRRAGEAADGQAG